MSLNTLAPVGLNSTITKDGCVVTDGDFRIHSPIRNGLCIWSEEGISAENGRINGLFASIAPKKVSLTDWHERLGHVSKNTLLKFGEAIEDLDIDPGDHEDEDEQQTPCESCTHGKHARSRFKPRTEQRKNALELVHSDLTEANVTSIGGGKYVLTFKDDATSHGTVFILANKQPSTVLKAFKPGQNAKVDGKSRSYESTVVRNTWATCLNTSNLKESNTTQPPATPRNQTALQKE